MTRRRWLLASGIGVAVVAAAAIVYAAWLTIVPQPRPLAWDNLVQPAAGALDGKLVSIAGYVVPLAFVQTKVSEFLLVPYLGACIHVPPPPTNQIVLVKLARPAEIEDGFEAMVVTGRMTVARATTSLAEVGYQLAADGMVPYE